MELDEQKIDDAVLALLFLSLHDDQRAWKSMDWDAMDRLYQHEFIHDPASKAKSVVLTDSGVAHARRLCEQLFAKPKRQTVRVRYGGAVADAEVADGMAGVLHRDIDGKYFFRVTAAAPEQDGMLIGKDGPTLQRAPSSIRERRGPATAQLE